MNRKSSITICFLRIGLDPAGPYFENTDPKVRLDSTDALFVDVIHTDGSNNLLLGFGINNFTIKKTFINNHEIYLGSLQQMGHVDFYPNGGYNQPKCPKTPGKIINLFLQLGQINVEGNINFDFNSINYLNRFY